MIQIPLFVYGTLLVPEIVSAVIGRLPVAQPATLVGYGRFRMAGKHYPGLRAESGVSTDGAVLCGLTSEELCRLDAYEGEEYVRQQLIAFAEGRTLPAHVYVVRDLRNLSNEAWQLESFLNGELDAFRHGEFRTLLKA